MTFPFLAPQSTHLVPVYYNDFWSWLAYRDFREVVFNSEPPADDDGFYYSRFIPGDRVDDHLCTEFYPDTCDLVLRCVECDAPVA